MDGTEAASLRAISDAFVERLKVIFEMEAHKRTIPPTDPAFPVLADEVEESVRLLLEHASAQRAESWQAHDAELQVPIDRIPVHLSAAELLSRWRSYEHELSRLDPLTPEAHTARLNIEAHRRAYQKAFRAKIGMPSED